MAICPSSSSCGVSFKDGKGQYQKRFIKFFSFFGMKLLSDDINNIS